MFLYFALANIIKTTKIKSMIAGWDQIDFHARKTPYGSARYNNLILTIKVGSSACS